MAYICGFDGQNSKELRLYIERQWKIKRDQMQRDGIQDPRLWAKNGQTVINDVVDRHDFNVQESDLALVCLFRDIVSE